MAGYYLQNGIYNDYIIFYKCSCYKTVVYVIYKVVFTKINYFTKVIVTKQWIKYGCTLRPNLFIFRISDCTSPWENVLSLHTHTTQKVLLENWTYLTPIIVMGGVQQSIFICWLYILTISFQWVLIVFYLSTSWSSMWELRKRTFYGLHQYLYCSSTDIELNRQCNFEFITWNYCFVHFYIYFKSAPFNPISYLNTMFSTFFLDCDYTHSAQHQTLSGAKVFATPPLWPTMLHK